MVSEVSTTSVKKSFGQTAAGYFAFPVAQTALGAVGAVKLHKGIGKAIEAQNKGAFKAIGRQIKTDIFTKSDAMANCYDGYKSLVKADAKSANKLAKLTKKIAKDQETTGGAISELFKKRRAGKLEGLKASSEAATTALDNAKKALTEAGDGLTETAAKGLDDLGMFKGTKFQNIAKNATQSAPIGLKATAKGFTSAVKGNIRRQLSLKTGWFGYAMTLAFTLPEIFSDVVPTFKEKGAKEGFKALGKTLTKAGGTFISNIAGGSIGRVIGGAVGMIFGAPGAAIGATIGDMVGSTIAIDASSKIMNKISGKKDKEDAQPEMNTTVQPQIAQAQPQMNPMAQPQFVQPQIVQPMMQPQFAQQPYGPQPMPVGYGPMPQQFAQPQMPNQQVNFMA